MPDARQGRMAFWGGAGVGLMSGAIGGPFEGGENLGYIQPVESEYNLIVCICSCVAAKRMGEVAGCF